MLKATVSWTTAGRVGPAVSQHLTQKTYKKNERLTSCLFFPPKGAYHMFPKQDVHNTDGHGIFGSATIKSSNRISKESPQMQSPKYLEIYGVLFY